MSGYKSEIVEMPTKFFKGFISEEKVCEINDLINKRAAEGWALVSHTYMFEVGESAKDNALHITFEAAEGHTSSTEYKCELVEVPQKFLSTALISDKQVLEMDGLFNQRTAEGWKPITHSFMSAAGHTPVMFVTFLRNNAAL